MSLAPDLIIIMPFYRAVAGTHFIDINIDVKVLLDMMNVRHVECQQNALGQRPLSLSSTAHLHPRPCPERLPQIMSQSMPSTSGRNATVRMKQPSAVTAALVAERLLSQEAMKIVDVPLGDRSYPIYIGEGLLDHGELLQQHVPGKRVLIVTNETIAPLYLQRYDAATPVL